MPLGDVVGIRHVAIGDEHEQVRPVGGDALAQLASRFAARDSCHDAVEPAIQIGKILLERDVLEFIAAAPDGDRAQQQSLECGAEGGVAAFDGVSRIAQQMRLMPTSA
jgi:hypothetical protein